MRRGAIFIFVLLLLAGMVGGLSYFQFVAKPAMIKGFISKAAPPPGTVAAAVAKTESWASEIPAIGTFRAVQGVDIAPQVGGVVSAIHFDSGQDAAKGQPLVNIDDTVEEADLTANVANLKNADLTLQRQRQLIAGGNTARSSLDQAQATRDQAAAAVARSHALIAQKALTAPFSGRLGLRNVDVGQYVSPGTSVVTLQQLDPIDAEFPIPEQSFGALKVGQSVTVSVDAWPGRTFSGKVASIDARVSADTRNVLVRAEIENKSTLLRPGMFANVSVLAGAPQSVTTLPRTAITFSLYGDSVFVVKPAPPSAAGSAQAATPNDQLFVVERRPVQVGDTRADRVAIKEGVTPGDRVISEGQVKLQNGARVKIDNSAALPPSLQPRPQE